MDPPRRYPVTSGDVGGEQSFEIDLPLGTRERRRRHQRDRDWDWPVVGADDLRLCSPGAPSQHVNVGVGAPGDRFISTPLLKRGLDGRFNQGVFRGWREDCLGGSGETRRLAVHVAPGLAGKSDRRPARASRTSARRVAVRLGHVIVDYDLSRVHTVRRRGAGGVVVERVDSGTGCRTSDQAFGRAAP